MKFLQISDGTAVRKKDVVAVEKLPDGGSRVWTLATSYDCPFLYESIMQLLEVEDLEEAIPRKEPVDKINLWGKQHFVG